MLPGPGIVRDPGLSFVTDLPRELLALWVSLCVDGRLPRRSDFDFARLRRHLGWLCVVEVVDEGADFRYRLIGTNIVDRVGRDMSGRLVSQVLPASALDIFRDAMHERAAVRTHGPVSWRGKGFLRHETLILPLADDGRTVDRFLVEMVFPDMPVAKD